MPKFRRFSLVCGFIALFGGPNSGWSADVRVLVWDEQQPAQKTAYGDKFLGETIAAHLSRQPGLQVKSTSLASPEQGLDLATLDETDVLVMWGHVKNLDLDAARAEQVVQRVLSGKLALIALHSAHWAKPFVRLMQERAKSDARENVPEADQARSKWEFQNETPIGKGVKADDRLTPFVTREGDAWKLTLPSCVFPSWRADGAASQVTTLLPNHPLAVGLPAKWSIPHTEMYSEPFHVPKPDGIVFEEHWEKGEQFRSGCVWQVGQGRVFYFRPGHETYPVYQQPEPLRVIENAVRWLRPRTLPAAVEKAVTWNFPDETIDEWHGYRRHTWTVDGCKAWLVEPKVARPGNPWSWCLEFPDAFTDRCAAPALLAHGFYHLHLTVGNTFGCPDALRHFDALYDVVTKAGLSSRGALIGISRGGLYAHNWAAQHPDRVTVIYGDAPVCDFKSWPGGKLTAKGSAGDWQQLLKAYHFADEAEALAFSHNPVDQLTPLAAAGNVIGRDWSSATWTSPALAIPVAATVTAAHNISLLAENGGTIKDFGGSIGVGAAGIGFSVV